MQNYRGLLFGVPSCLRQSQLLRWAIVIPATFAGIALTPLAYLVSDRVFSFELFGDDWLLNRSVYEFNARELFVHHRWNRPCSSAPYSLSDSSARRMYAAWIRWIAGEEKAIDVSEPHGSAAC
ncbi:hypothetical protein [Cohnella faecalis]|uniref:Uncharacterized protein n=1 Tax=Cohnella faecalis TaxID=2315694 RepID=A0A398CVG0_9BACL|nr:hypothetical protein [Cohnella faecalis]RIE04508.1 hypothetical protein D3H35_05750 [Cohnella faecalis]